MSVKSDLSQLSEISSISSISNSSSSQHQLTLKQGTYNEYSLDKILNEVGKCEESICHVAHLRLIYDTLEQMVETNNESIPSDILKKLDRTLSIQCIDTCFTLPSSYKHEDDKLTTLGLMNIEKPEFSYEEKRLIKVTLEAELLKRIHQFIDRYQECGGNLIEAMGTNESSARHELSKLADPVLPHWRDKLEEICNEYYRDIVIFNDLLKQWRRLKHEDIEELNMKTAQTKLLQSEIAELQIRITKFRCAVKMFKETPVTLDAFKILNNTLDEKLDSVRAEIKKKTILLKQYNDLEGTEYDDILKRYIHLCTTIEKDERLLNNL